MEAFLYYNCLVSSSRIAEGINKLRPDSHISDICIDMRASGKDKTHAIKAVKLKEGLRFNLVGRVTRFQSEQSIFLTEAFGQTFYVEPGLRF